LQTYGTDNVLGITVSNEFMPNYIPEHTAPSTNGTDGLAASALLKSKITNIWQMLASMNINLPVGTADTSSYFDNDLLSAMDFGCAFHFFNVKLLMLFFWSSRSSMHMWFVGTTIHATATWTFTFFKETNIDVANALVNKPQMYATKTGWQTFFTEKTDSTLEASEPNQQISLDTFVRMANTNTSSSSLTSCVRNGCTLAWRDSGSCSAATRRSRPLCYRITCMPD
jgi:hypothetical protein